MEYWYEVLATRKANQFDFSGVPVRLLIHVVNNEVVDVTEVG